jgi:hypothetical protein
MPALLEWVLPEVNATPQLPEGTDALMPALPGGAKMLPQRFRALPDVPNKDDLLVLALLVLEECQLSTRTLP